MRLFTTLGNSITAMKAPQKKEEPRRVLSCTGEYQGGSWFPKFDRMLASTKSERPHMTSCDRRRLQPVRQSEHAHHPQEFRIRQSPTDKYSDRRSEQLRAPSPRIVRYQSGPDNHDPSNRPLESRLSSTYSPKLLKTIPRIERRCDYFRSRPDEKNNACHQRNAIDNIASVSGTALFPR